MTRDDILSAMESLSRSQGRWGRMLNVLRESKANMDAFFKVYNPSKYNDVVDFIMDIEG